MPFMAHITTLTLNPSVDVLTTTAQVMDTHKLRCTAPQYHPGGGGINVARVVHRLGGSVQALWGAAAVCHPMHRQIFTQISPKWLKRNKRNWCSMRLAPT